MGAVCKYVSPFYRCLPFEALHTLPLGPAKHLLREQMPLLSKGQKAEILARLKAFHTSGFSVKLYGNVCYYYQSFCGRDFKAWVQMALFIIGPYLDDGELAVWKSFCKVIRYFIHEVLFMYVHSTRCSRLRTQSLFLHHVVMSGDACARHTRCA